MPRGGAWEHGGLGKKGVLRARRDSMSRLTTAQVISLGHYLEPDFDPASLTVSQLLGVLGYHNIKYPTPYSKPKLVQLFNDEIKTRSSKFKKEKIKKQNSIASDEGIKDGLTGQPLTTTRRVCTIALNWCNPTMSLNRICLCDVLRVDYRRLLVRTKKPHPFARSRWVDFVTIYTGPNLFCKSSRKGGGPLHNLDLQGHPRQHSQSILHSPRRVNQKRCQRQK